MTTRVVQFYFGVDTQPADRLPATPDPLGSPSDPLSSEDIDAQIRWFFDNVRERKSARL